MFKVIVEMLNAGYSVSEIAEQLDEPVDVVLEIQTNIDLYTLSDA